MLKKCYLCWTVIIFWAIMGIAASSTTVYGDEILRIGSRGHLVIKIQGYLQRLNYLRQKPSGYYGRITAEAIKSFQLEHALTADGIVGPETMAALELIMTDENRGINYRIISDEMVASRGRTGGIQTIPWSIVNQLWKTGEIATIIDLVTGRSFQARRLFGFYHADVEPLTENDTETMLAVYGGSWSWSRRAVVIHLRNLFIAASINGMPHGRKTIAGNGFPGQFCTHFLGSRVHQSGMVDPEHLAMIKKAAGADLSLLGIGTVNKENLLTQSYLPLRY